MSSTEGFTPVKPKTVCLRGSIGWIDFEFGHLERTPCELMPLGIRLHIEPITVKYSLEEIEIWCRTKSKSRPRLASQSRSSICRGAETAKVALDETVILIDDQQYWLSAAVNPATIRFLHVRLYSTPNTALTEMFLANSWRTTTSKTAYF